jgi:ribosomal protein S3AE
MEEKTKAKKGRRIRQVCKKKIEKIRDEIIIKKLLEYICFENIPFEIIDDGFDILLHRTSRTKIEKLENELNSLLNINDEQFTIDLDNII